jgi:glycosyltransferase involved in cell wall biosynthesis
MIDLVPLLQASEKVSEIVLFFDKSVSEEALAANLPWWNKVSESDKFIIHFSSAKYYSIKEQTTFLFELNSYDFDLVYFFTFNYPILYKRPYIYQVLDLSLPKSRPNWSPKIQAMLLCFRTGVKNATHILFLGHNTLKDSEHYSNMCFEDPKSDSYVPNTIIYNGIGEQFYTTESANEDKAVLVNLSYSKQKEQELTSLKDQYSITKPYFFFISVWRKYKNIERLVQAFDQFNTKHNNAYQLVLGGGVDKNAPEVLDNVKANPQFELGNIVITGRIESDADVVLLYDGAEALVAPSLSEGFGLWMVEAACRGLPVIASDIPIFHEIANGLIQYFDPYSIDSIEQQLTEFIARPTPDVRNNIQQLYSYTKRFRWMNTAITIKDIIEEHI